MSSDKEPKEFRIYHRDNPTVSILGHFSVDEGYIVFTPALPFPKGRTFAIAHKEEQIAIFKVDEVKAIKTPELNFIYPRFIILKMGNKVCCYRDNSRQPRQER